MTLDEKIKDIDEKLIENDCLYLKLQQLENELERFQPMEQTLYKKDCIFEELNKQAHVCTGSCDDYCGT